MNVFLLVLFFITTLLYFPLNKRPAQYYFARNIDSYLPMVPAFIFVYSLYFPYLVGSIYVLWGTPYATQFLSSICAAVLTSTIFWYFVPNGVKRHALRRKTVSAKFLNKVYRFDGDTNACPSNHVFISLICGYFLILQYPEWILPITAMSTGIALSTLLVKQHYIVDVIAGMAWCLASIGGSSLILSVLFHI